jgi:hypothetical protein
MPRYFFHVKRGQVTVLDQEGIELAGIEEAEQEAFRLGREIASDEAFQGSSAGGGMIIIDEDWRTVLELPFDDLTG